MVITGTEEVIDLLGIVFIPLLQLLLPLSQVEQWEAMPVSDLAFPFNPLCKARRYLDLNYLLACLDSRLLHHCSIFLKLAKTFIDF